MKFTWDQIQQAFVNGDISFEDLMSILVDNYGAKETVRILEHNLFPKK